MERLKLEIQTIEYSDSRSLNNQGYIVLLFLLELTTLNIKLR